MNHLERASSKQPAVLKNIHELAKRQEIPTYRSVELALHDKFGEALIRLNPTKQMRNSTFIEILPIGADHLLLKTLWRDQGNKQIAVLLSTQGIAEQAYSWNIQKGQFVLNTNPSEMELIKLYFERKVRGSKIDTTGLDPTLFKIRRLKNRVQKAIE